MATVLYILKPMEYLSKVIEIVKQVSSDHFVIYVTTNKPYSSLKNIFSSNKINTNKIFFIDCVSKSVGKADSNENVVLLDSPANLTNLSIAIVESIKNIQGKKILFLDSLSTLALFNDSKVLERFSHYLINQMELFNSETAILTLETDMDKNILNMVSSMVDKVIKVDDSD